jgi:hypothetical protein
VVDTDEEEALAVEVAGVGGERTSTSLRKQNGALIIGGNFS